MTLYLRPWRRGLETLVGGGIGLVRWCRGSPLLPAAAAAYAGIPLATRSRPERAFRHRPRQKGAQDLDWPLLAKDRQRWSSIWGSPPATIREQLLTHGKGWQHPVALIERGTQPSASRSFAVPSISCPRWRWASRPALIMVGSVVTLADRLTPGSGGMHRQRGDGLGLICCIHSNATLGWRFFCISAVITSCFESGIPMGTVRRIHRIKGNSASCPPQEQRQNSVNTTEPHPHALLADDAHHRACSTRRGQDAALRDQTSELTRLVNSPPAADIADALESLPRTERHVLWQQVDADKHGQIWWKRRRRWDSLISGMRRQRSCYAPEHLDIDDQIYLGQHCPAT